MAEGGPVAEPDRPYRQLFFANLPALPFALKWDGKGNKRGKNTGLPWLSCCTSQDWRLLTSVAGQPDNWDFTLLNLIHGLVQIRTTDIEKADFDRFISNNTHVLVSTLVIPFKFKRGNPNEEGNEEIGLLLLYGDNAEFHSAAGYSQYEQVSRFNAFWDMVCSFFQQYGVFNYTAIEVAILVQKGIVGVLYNDETMTELDKVSYYEPVAESRFHHKVLFEGDSVVRKYLTLSLTHHTRFAAPVRHPVELEFRKMFSFADTFVQLSHRKTEVPHRGELLDVLTGYVYEPGVYDEYARCFSGNTFDNPYIIDFDSPSATMCVHPPPVTSLFSVQTPKQDFSYPIAEYRKAVSRMVDIFYFKESNKELYIYYVLFMDYDEHSASQRLVAFPFKKTSAFYTALPSFNLWRTNEERRAMIMKLKFEERRKTGMVSKPDLLSKTGRFADLYVLRDAVFILPDRVSFITVSPGVLHKKIYTRVLSLSPALGVSASILRRHYSESKDSPIPPSLRAAVDGATVYRILMELWERDVSARPYLSQTDSVAVAIALDRVTADDIADDLSPFKLEKFKNNILQLCDFEGSADAIMSKVDLSRKMKFSVKRMFTPQTVFTAIDRFTLISELLEEDASLTDLVRSIRENILVLERTRGDFNNAFKRKEVHQKDDWLGYVESDTQFDTAVLLPPEYHILIHAFEPKKEMIDDNLTSVSKSGRAALATEMFIGISWDHRLQRGGGGTEGPLQPTIDYIYKSQSALWDYCSMLSALFNSFALYPSEEDEGRLHNIFLGSVGNHRMPNQIFEGDTFIDFNDFSSGHEWEAPHTALELENLGTIPKGLVIFHLHGTAQGVYFRTTHYIYRLTEPEYDGTDFYKRKWKRLTLKETEAENVLHLLAY